MSLKKVWFQPDVIVHCAAERRPDVVERHTEAAVNLNVHATSTLAKEAGKSLFPHCNMEFILSLFSKKVSPPLCFYANT